MTTAPRKPPYLLGLLGFIPLVGAFVGLGLILYGAIYYRSKGLIIIGALCILFTIGVYSTLFYVAFHSKLFDKANVEMTQTMLDKLAREIEFYKMENGSYPDSLPQLSKKYKIVFTNDLMQKGPWKIRDYQYQKIDSQYTLFSVGIDGTPHTADDIYPVVPDSGRIKYGLIKR